MSSYEEFTDARIKHLELIQAVIARLGANAFAVKGWAVTVAGLLLGFAVNNNKWGLALVSAIPTLAFWGLDTYFLRSERLFRALYDAVSTGSATVKPFFMGATASSFVATVQATRTKTSWWRTAVRPTLWVFYCGLLAAAIVVAVVLCRS